MIKLNVQNASLNAGDTIPFTQEFNSNGKFSFSNNGINVKKTGFVEIIGTVNITATATGVFTINMIVDGTTVTSYSEVASTIGDVITIPIYNSFRILPQNITNGFANVSLQLVNASTVSGGNLTGKYIE